MEAVWKACLEAALVELCGLTGDPDRDLDRVDWETEEQTGSALHVLRGVGRAGGREVVRMLAYLSVDGDCVIIDYLSVTKRDLDAGWELLDQDAHGRPVSDRDRRIGNHVLVTAALDVLVTVTQACGFAGLECLPYADDLAALYGDMGFGAGGTRLDFGDPDCCAQFERHVDTVYAVAAAEFARFRPPRRRGQGARRPP